MARSASLLLLWFGSWVICSPQQCWGAERFGRQATRGRLRRLCVGLLFLCLDLLETTTSSEVLSRDDPHHLHLLPPNHQGLSFRQGGQLRHLVATPYTQTCNAEVRTSIHKKRSSLTFFSHFCENDLSS